MRRASATVTRRRLVRLGLRYLGCEARNGDRRVGQLRGQRDVLRGGLVGGLVSGLVGSCRRDRLLILLPAQQPAY